MSNDLISRSALKKAIAEFHQEENERLHTPLWGSIGLNALDNIIDNAPTVEPKLSDEQIEKIADLLETEWGYEGIREDVLRILREADNEM